MLRRLLIAAVSVAYLALVLGRPSRGAGRAGRAGRDGRGRRDEGAARERRGVPDRPGPDERAHAEGRTAALRRSARGAVPGQGAAPRLSDGDPHRRRGARRPPHHRARGASRDAQRDRARAGAQQRVRVEPGRQRELPRAPHQRLAQRRAGPACRRQREPERQQRRRLDHDLAARHGRVANRREHRRHPPFRSVAGRRAARARHRPVQRRERRLQRQRELDRRPGELPHLGTDEAVDHALHQLVRHLRPLVVRRGSQRWARQAEHRGAARTPLHRLAVRRPDLRRSKRLDVRARRGPAAHRRVHEAALLARRQADAQRRRHPQQPRQLADVPRVRAGARVRQRPAQLRQRPFPAGLVRFSGAARQRRAQRHRRRVRRPLHARPLERIAAGRAGAVGRHLRLRRPLRHRVVQRDGAASHARTRPRYECEPQHLHARTLAVLGGDHRTATTRRA